MNNFISQELKNKEKSRQKKIKSYKQLSLTEYITKKEEIADDFLFFSAYDFFMCKQKRQETGAVFTPEWITEAMARNTINQWQKNNTNLWDCIILDPCCGTGNYVHSLINVLKNTLFSLYPEKNEHEIITHIIQNMIYAWDINSDSLAVCRERILSIFKVAPKNITEKNTLFENPEPFDIIIGNPPYGDLLSLAQKERLKDSHKNIALNFIDWATQHIKPTGEVSFIVPHTFTRAKEYQKWRDNLYQNKYLHQAIDVGNPFSDITLEEVIFSFNLQKNQIIQSGGIKNKTDLRKVDLNNFYNSNRFYKMVLYYDNIYQLFENTPHTFPFSGKRGHDISKKTLKDSPDEHTKWLILGKNIKKNNIIHIENYDCYISPHQEKTKYIINTPKVAITQFGTNLKAAILNQEHYPSGGVVLVNGENLTNQQILEYLNQPVINYYLNRYVFNDAKLTVHIDGIYLAEIPYIQDLTHIQAIYKQTIKQQGKI